MASSSNNQYDFIIIGAGVGGSVVASRLHKDLPHLSILLIEAGSDVSDHPLVAEAKTFPLLLGSDMDWGYSTVPQRHLNNRVVVNNAGKALGGGSAINAGISAKIPKLYSIIR